MHLDDAGIELRGELRNRRLAVVASGDDDPVSSEAPLTRLDEVTVAGFRHAVDRGGEPNRKLEARRVSLEVVGRLARGRNRPARSRERPPGQAVVARRREQAERVPG